MGRKTVEERQTTLLRDHTYGIYPAFLYTGCTGMYLRYSL